tara:strand:- start:33633 stop:34121 length:489 start_codon:yes stop_codon:yes gene_type:complete
MSDNKTGASNEELLKKIADLEAENAAKDARIARMDSNNGQEKLNAGKTISITEQDENGKAIAIVEYQFTRGKLNIAGLGEITAAKLLSNQSAYGLYITKLISRGSELITEVSRKAVEAAPEKPATIAEMKEALTAAGVEFDGSQKKRAYYEDLIVELNKSEE